MGSVPVTTLQVVLLAELWEQQYFLFFLGFEPKAGMPIQYNRHVANDDPLITGKCNSCVCMHPFQARTADSVPD
jgi:hypothetical protein